MSTSSVSAARGRPPRGDERRRQILEAFGRRPRGRSEPVRDALTRIWVSTLYGYEWLQSESSTLVRE